MSEDLDRIVRLIEDEAVKLGDPGLEQGAAAAAAAEVARLAGEAVGIVEAFTRGARPAPKSPGQGRLPVDESSA